MGALFTDNMPPRVTPPDKGVRLISKHIWARLFGEWQEFMYGLRPEKPKLAPGTRVFFTDAESLFVCRTPHELDLRVGPTLRGFKENGGAVIFFNTDGLTVDVPDPSAGSTEPGLTNQGAREWATQVNVDVDLQDDRMEVFLVEPSNERSGPVKPGPVLP